MSRELRAFSERRKHLVGAVYSLIQNTPMSYSLHFQMRKLKLMKMKLFAQGHAAGVLLELGFESTIHLLLFHGVAHITGKIVG